METGTNERKVDALVAEKIFGIKVLRGDEITGWGTPGYIQRPNPLDFYFWNDEADEIQPIRHYTHNLESAWTIIKKMSSQYRISVHDISKDGMLWQCAFEIRDGKSRFGGMLSLAHEGDEYANAPTPSEAICLAALKAAGIPSTELT